MTFEQVWATLIRKNSVLNNPKSVVEFESANLKKLLEQVYDKGRESVPSGDFPFSNLFGNVSG